MNLLTLNCHSWLEENQEEKIKILVSTIIEQQYDIITLQEVNQSLAGKIVEGQIREDNFSLILLTELKKLGCTQYQMIWDCSHISYGIYEEGLSVLTRHPIEEEYSFFISKTQDINNWKARKIVGAKIILDNKLVDVYSCHLGWWQDQEEPFKDQVDTLLHHIKKEELVLLLGDFNNNAFITGEGYDYLLAQGLYDTFTLAKVKDSGITVQGTIDGWIKNQQNLRLDMILATKKVKVSYSAVIFNGENKQVVSDHYGVVAEFL